jgi:hypothetical protein
MLGNARASPAVVNKNGAAPLLTAGIMQFVQAQFAAAQAK